MGFSHHRPWRRDRGKNSWENVPQKGSSLRPCPRQWVECPSFLFLTALVQYWIYCGICHKKNHPQTHHFHGIKTIPSHGNCGLALGEFPHYSFFWGPFRGKGVLVGPASWKFRRTTEKIVITIWLPVVPHKAVAEVSE